MLLVQSAKHKFSHVHKYFLEKLKKTRDYQKFKLKYELNHLNLFSQFSLCLAVSNNTENKKKTGKYQQQHHQSSYRKNKNKC